MAFIMDKKTLENYQELNLAHNHLSTKLYVENDETLIKLSPTFNLNKFKYLEKLPEHENVIKPKESGIVTDNNKKQSCYRMKYLKGAKTFLELYKENISYEQKMFYINELFSTLKFLHNYIVLGDIHSSNILVSSNHAFITDLDNAEDINKKIKFIDCKYYLTILKYFEGTKYTDITKLYIECLGFILGYNFSNAIGILGYKEFYKVIKSYHLPKEIENFLKISHNPHNLKQLGDEAYNIEQFMNEEILSLKRILKSFSDY